jgi:hypothetical protein
MKKTYIIPELNITKLAVENMIAQSITGTQGADGIGVGGSSSGANVTAGNVKDNESYNVWDDDWSR